MGKDEKIKELTEKDLEKVSGGILDDLPTVDEHDYDEDVKEKIKMP
jgi:bacteriocin-like protein